MSRRKQPATMAIEVDRYYDRLAWHVWQGQQREADALRNLAPWFDPPLRIDEGRVQQRVQRYSDASAQIHNPANWS